MSAIDVGSGAVQYSENSVAASSAALSEEIFGLHDADVVRFIPVSRTDILNRLLAPEYWPGHDTKPLASVLYYIGRLRQQDSAIKLDELMDKYQLFNPDSDMEFAETLSDEEKLAQRNALIKNLEQLIFRANFERITREELERVLSETSPYGVEIDVDLDEFAPLLPYYRGVRMRENSRRDWRWAYTRKRHYVIPSYERFFLALTLKPEEERIAEIMKKEGVSRKFAERKFHKLRKRLPEWVNSEQIYLKMFKDIPQIDIDMLLPNNGVKFRLFDRFMLWFSGGGSAVYAVVVSILKLLAVAISPILLFMTLFGVGGTLFRQVMSVINTRTRYMMELVQKLYFHNISSNQGALTLLIDEAEEEDIKEDQLLYAFLLKQSPDDLSLDRARRDVAAFLLNEFRLKVNFDHEEAFGRLTQRNLAGRDANGKIWLMPPLQAARHLRDLWIEALDLRAGSATLLDASHQPGG